jgi:hypothetical protein
MASLIIGPLDWAGFARTVAEHRVAVHLARLRTVLFRVRTIRDECGRLEAAREHADDATRCILRGAKKAALRKTETLAVPDGRLGVEHTMSWLRRSTHV